MEQADRDLLLHILATDRNLKRLYDQHLKLEKEVEQFGRYVAYSSAAALKQKELKKAKLLKKERIMSILNEHREQIAT
ncbi:MAG: hypothetical protein KDD69_17515 [Bdellovibrionales bacterium]|nr:hypothetical protein [Bdellovibrionales bacterium]